MVVRRTSPPRTRSLDVVMRRSQNSDACSTRHKCATSLGMMWRPFTPRSARQPRLDWLERAMEITFVDLDPAVDAIRTHPRFRPIVKQLPMRLRALFARKSQPPRSQLP